MSAAQPSVRLKSYSSIPALAMPCGNPGIGCGYHSGRGISIHANQRGLFARIWLSVGLFALLIGACVPARAQQVIDTIAGGFNSSSSSSEKACAPVFSAAPHGTDVYVSSCDQIFKVSAAGQWTHVAGTGIYGFSPDGTPASSASLGDPDQLSLDASGNIFFNENFNDRVREIVVATGQLLTVAGTGTPGFSGDNGPAINAQIRGGATGVFVDGHGNVFIADNGNNRIREVVAATGIIQTVAGNGTRGFSGDLGPATSAHLSRPRGVFVDGAGNIFIADTGNLRIREVVAATGIINTVAGNGTGGFFGDGGAATSAELASPVGVFLDSLGDIFIADEGNGRIRKVVGGPGGNIQTVAGNGGDVLSGCNGGVNTCIGVGGPATSALVPIPQEVTLDASGNIFISATTFFGRNFIEEVVATTGSLQIFAGNGAQDFTGNNGPATLAQLNAPSFAASDGVGNVFIADANNNVIEEVVATTGIIKIVAGTGVAGYSGDGGPATSAELSGPFSVFADVSGNLFIADSNNNVIREVVAATGVINTVAGNYLSACGSLGDGGPATSAALCTPTSAVVDGSGNLFIADSNNSVIREVVAATGIINTVAGNANTACSTPVGDGGPATSAALCVPTSAFVDGSGDLFIADSLNNVIREVVAATGIIRTVAGNGTQGYSGDGGPATSAEFYQPSAVWGDASGNFFVSEYYNEVVRKFTVGGNVQTVAGNRVQGSAGDGGPATSAELDSPNSVFVESSGSLLIADANDGRVRIVGSATTTTLTPSANPSFLGQPVTITATVAPTAGGTPIGSVTFLDNGTMIGSGGVDSSGRVTLTTSSLVAGAHPITAQYYGTNFPGSISSTLTETIANPNPSTTALASSLNPSVGGQSVTFTATVTSAASGTPTGTVNFLDNGALLPSGTIALDAGGHAAFTTTNLSVSNHPITAQYSGDLSFAGSTSAVVSQVITAAAFAPSTPQSVTAGGPLTVNLTMFGAPPSTLSYSLSCSNLPANSSCTFLPNPVTPAAPPTGTTVQLMFITHAATPPFSQPRGPVLPMMLELCASLAAMLLGGLLASHKVRHRRLAYTASLATLFLAAIVLTGCGSNSSSSPGSNSNSTPKGAAAINVVATPSGGGSTVSTVVHVTVN